MKCKFNRERNGDLQFYLTEFNLAPFVKSLILFLPILALIMFDQLSLTLTLILGLSYFMKVIYYLLLTIDIHGFKAVHQALEDRETLFEQNLSTLVLFKKQEQSLKRIQDIYLLGMVVLAFWFWEFLSPTSLLGHVVLILILFYEILLFYFKSNQLKQITGKCFIRVQALMR